MLPGKVIQWDADVWIAWLTDEKSQAPGVMEGIESVVKAAEGQGVTLASSVVLLSELYGGKWSSAARKKFDDIFKRRNVLTIDVDHRIARLASQIREFYDGQKPPIKLKTPDALHLATAIIWKVDEFQTLDKGLLRFNGDVMGHDLKICAPYQQQLTLQLPPANDSEIAKLEASNEIEEEEI